jgi:putative nucleotidyltransferase with HDIG domain
MSPDVKNLVENMPNIPSMPLIVLNLLDQLNKPEPDIIKLSSIISKDISLTAQLLKLVNSAYFSFSSRVNNVTQAAVLLGLNRVRDLVIGAAIKPMVVTICGKDLWEHSIRCAVGSELIAKKLNDDKHEEAFIAGLLHDIGKIILELYNVDVAKEVHNRVLHGNERIKTEKELFGFAHTEVGKELISKWNLPNYIGEHVNFHHDPVQSSDKLITSYVYVADKLGQENLMYPVIDPEISENMDFEVPDPVNLREEIFIASQPIIDVFSGKINRTLVKLK